MKLRTSPVASLPLVAALLVPAAPAAGQTSPTSVAGLWELTWETPRGAQTLRLDLAQEGAALTGTAESPRGEMALKDGKVEGEAVSFVLEMTIQGRDGNTRTLTQTFAGVLADGVVTGEITMSGMGAPGGGGGGGRPGGMGGPRPFTMKRVEG